MPFKSPSAQKGKAKRFSRQSKESSSSQERQAFIPAKKSSRRDQHAIALEPQPVGVALAIDYDSDDEDLVKIDIMPFFERKSGNGQQLQKKSSIKDLFRRGASDIAAASKDEAMPVTEKKSDEELKTRLEASANLKQGGNLPPFQSQNGFNGFAESRLAQLSSQNMDKSPPAMKTSASTSTFYGSPLASPPQVIKKVMPASPASTGLKNRDGSNAPNRALPATPIRPPTKSQFSTPASASPKPLNPSTKSNYSPLAAFYGSKSTSSTSSPIQDTKSFTPETPADLKDSATFALQDSTEEPARSSPVPTALDSPVALRSKPQAQAPAIEATSEARKAAATRQLPVQLTQQSPALACTATKSIPRRVFTKEGESLAKAANPESLVRAPNKESLPALRPPQPTHTSKASVDTFRAVTQNLAGSENVELIQTLPVKEHTAPTQDEVQSPSLSFQQPTPTAAIFSPSCQDSVELGDSPPVRQLNRLSRQSGSEMSDSQFELSPTMTSSLSGSSSLSMASSTTSDGIHTMGLPASPKSRQREARPTSKRLSNLRETRQLDLSAKPIFEYGASILLNLLLPFCSLESVLTLRNVSQRIRDTIDEDNFREKALLRWIGPYGYVPIAANVRTSVALPAHARRHSESISSGKQIEPPHISYKDLRNFMTYTAVEKSEFAKYAKLHQNKPLANSSVQLLQDACSAYTKVLLRIRLQPVFNPKVSRPIQKPGRAIQARVWIPCKGNWMSDEELVECERSLFNAGLWDYIQRGDCVHNCAIGDFANEGKVLSDGRYLRDLSFTYDAVGHLPSWINAMSFSPSFFHSAITASSSEGPVVYLDVTSFASQVESSLTLLQDKVEVDAPNGKHFRVTKYIYRATINLKAGAILGSTDGSGVATIHDEWNGQLVIETEGTSECAAALVRLCTPQKYINRMKAGSDGGLHPFKILRGRSRLGRIVARPLFAADRVG